MAWLLKLSLLLRQLFLLLVMFAAAAACGEAVRANLGTENVFIQGDIFCAGTGVGVADCGCGIERHGVSHRLAGEVLI